MPVTIAILAWEDKRRTEYIIRDSRVPLLRLETGTRRTQVSHITA